jgi:hypothetical protein
MALSHLLSRMISYITELFRRADPVQRVSSSVTMDNYVITIVIDRQDSSVLRKRVHSDLNTSNDRHQVSKTLTVGNASSIHVPDSAYDPQSSLYNSFGHNV